MVKDLVNATLLTVKGLILLSLALVDWLAAKANVSRRPYLMPFRVASEFRAAIGAVWHGQRRSPSLRACTHCNRDACGPSPDRSIRSSS